MSLNQAEPRPGTPRVAFATFGCKLNQWETQLLERGAAKGCALVDFDADADVYVINTCTVTGSSDAQARRLIRRTLRRRPGAKVVVTGCYAERAEGEISSIDGVALVVGNEGKGLLAELLRKGVFPERKPAGGNGRRSVELAQEGAGDCGASRDCAANRVASADVVGADLGDTGRDRAARGQQSKSGWPQSSAAWGPANSRSRAHVAIQTGCDRHCAYCIVPSVRGSARSFPVSSVTSQVEALLEEGFREIVLTGTYLGDYGADLEGSIDFPGLVRCLNGLVDGRARLRISSLSPSDITDKLVEAIAASGNVCRHFHVAFQSGDDGILAAMGRGYGARAVRLGLRALSEAFPDCGLGGDAMVGFPGERDGAFKRTIELVESLPFSYLHVFVFSPRPGTAAAAYGERVPVERCRDRSRRLRALAARKGLDFTRRFVGRRVEVIAEGEINAEGGYAKPQRLEGTSEEYLRVQFDGDPSLKGLLLPVEVGGAISHRRVWGRVRVH